MTGPTPEKIDAGILRVLGLIRISLSYVWLLSLVGKSGILSLPDSLWSPVSLGMFFSSIPPKSFIYLLYAVALGSTLFLAAGVFTRLTGPVCFFSGAMYMSLAMSFGKISHGANSTLLIMFVMLFSDWGGAISFDQLWRRWRGLPRQISTAVWHEWPIGMSTLAIALPYLSAGMLKLVKGHFLAPGIFRRFLSDQLILIEHATVSSVAQWRKDAICWFIDHPLPANLLAYSTIVLELGFWVALFSRRLRMMALSAAITFHASISIFGDIHFGRHTTVCMILLLATAILLLRDKYSWLQRLFPPPRSIADDASSPVVVVRSAAAQVGACLAATAGILIAVGHVLPDTSELAVYQQIDHFAETIQSHMFRLKTRHMPYLMAMGVMACLSTALWAVLDWTGRRWARSRQFRRDP